MLKLTRGELLDQFPQSRELLEHRLKQDYVDGIIVFEREGKRMALVYGAPYSVKSWKDAEGREIEINYQRHQAVAYYQKPTDAAIAAE